MVFRKYHQQRFIRVYRPAGKELAQRMMERHSDVSRTACLRNRMLYLPIKTRSMRVCPRGVLGLCSLFQHFSIRVIRPIRVLLKTPLRVLCAIRVSIRIHAEFVPKTQQASLPNEAGFIGT